MIAPQGLRREVEDAALASLAALGAAFSRSDIVRNFEGRGVHRSTMFRWIDRALNGGTKTEDAAAQRIGSLVADIRRRASALPDTIGRASLALRLTEVIATAVVLVADTRGPGGKFKKPRLALDALELLRRSIVDAANLAALDDGTRDAMLREPIIRELAALLNPPARAERLDRGPKP